MKHSTVLLILAIIFTSSFALSNDTAATLGAGGIVAAKTNRIVMESEELEISVHKITIRYVFRNTTAEDINMLIAFPLPDLDGGLLANSPINLPNEKHPNFVDFSVAADGKQVKTAMEVRAFREDKDITRRLKLAGLSGNVLLDALNSELGKVPKAIRKRLEREGLIVTEDFNPPLPGIGKQASWATWKMRVKFYWRQHFPANGTVELVQTYKPVVGGSYITADDDGKLNVEPYCGEQKSLQQIAEVKTRHPVQKEGISLFERTIDYILTTANNWKGPIGRFRLIVSTESSEDILVTCMAGLKQVSATRYEFSTKDFSPKADLKLLILQPADRK